MAVSSPALSAALAEIVGRKHLFADPARLAASAVDGVTPRWIARAGRVEEVSRLLALATAERLAVAPRGSGSSMALGNAPRRLDLVLDLGRLTGVTDYVPEDMVASAAAGTALGALGERLARERQRLAIDPLGGAMRSIGGVLAAHASGPLRFRYGTARDLLLGVRFVQADGTVTWGGSRVVKSVTGYDVPKLLVGSLGTLGVIVEATLRVHPVPPATGSWLCAFSSPEAAQGFLSALLASPIEPDRLVLLGSSARRSCGWPGPGPAVLVSVASVEEAVTTQAAALADLASREGGEFRSIPSSAWETLGAALDAQVLLRLAGEARRIAAWLGRVEELAATAGLDVAGVGQAGHGVLQVAVRGVESAPSLGRDLVARLREELRAEGGSVVVERAPVALKSDLDVWGPIQSESMAIMERLKREFDPDGILNPGRFAGGL